MMTSLESFFELHPRLFHMAWAESWSSIIDNGLLSTAALLDLFEITGKERKQILEARRPQRRLIEHAKYGRATIRDQKPLSDVKLQRCLEGMTTQEWYKTLNQRVFFWTTKQRLFRLMGANEYRKEDHCVLVLDTKKLYTDYEKSITFSPINSGTTMTDNVLRGVNTFKIFEEFPYRTYKAKGRSNDDIFVELTVDYSVRNITKYLVGAYLMNCNEIKAQLWPSTSINFDSL